MPNKSLEINAKKVHLMKAVTGADYNAKTVLTDSSWEYVELWLRRQRNRRATPALFYWRQARSFFDASELLPIESRPLTAYYCCLNAAKALLAINGDKSINLENISHGIGSGRNAWRTSNIKDVAIKFNGCGVLYELSKYFCESQNAQNYMLYDLLYNIPCIHRAFSLTYGCAELFIPIRDVGFVINNDIKEGWIQFQVDQNYANGNSLRNKPSRYEKAQIGDSFGYYLRSKKRFEWDIHGASMRQRLEVLSKYHKSVRKDIHYISGNTRLWYLKKDYPNNPHIIDRNSITLIYAVMHWLSEQVRYNPEKFAKIMDTKQNWLLTEFVDVALNQYIDEISCEITKTDIMTRGYR